jgi:hypothetical protein
VSSGFSRDAAPGASRRLAGCRLLERIKKHEPQAPLASSCESWERLLRPVFRSPRRWGRLVLRYDAGLAVRQCLTEYGYLYTTRTTVSRANSP